MKKIKWIVLAVAVVAVAGAIFLKGSSQRIGICIAHSFPVRLSIYIAVLHFTCIIYIVITVILDFGVADNILSIRDHRFINFLDKQRVFLALGLFRRFYHGDVSPAMGHLSAL